MEDGNLDPPICMHLSGPSDFCIGKSCVAECLLLTNGAPLTQPNPSDCRGSGIKLTWLRDLKERSQLTDENSIQVYVKCHIMLLIGTILFGDKSGASVHWKYLPLLSDFASIGQYSWGSACLAHLYRSLCRASRFDCKKIDGPLTLLLCWAWMRLPYLAPVPREPCSFSLANRCVILGGETGSVEIESIDIISLLIFGRPWMNSRRPVFVGCIFWDRVDPDIIPAEIYMHSVIWSATVPLGVSHQERSLDRAHGEVLTGPKNLNWATATSHSFWVMQWTNRYNHVLTDEPMMPQQPLDTYMYWYRSKYGDHLNLSDLAVQEDRQKNNLIPQASMYLRYNFLRHSRYISHILTQEREFLGFMALDAGQAQYSHLADFMAGRYSFDMRYSFYTYSGASGGFVSGDSSRSDGGRGVLNSQNPNHVSMTMIEENAKTCDHETAEYLVDEPDDDEDDEDEDDDMEEEDDEDEESRNDRGDTCTPGETGKGYNIRIDPPRRSASRYTPSMIKKAAKKCKNIVTMLQISYKPTGHYCRYLEDLPDGIYYDCVPQLHIAYTSSDGVAYVCPSHSRSASSWADLWKRVLGTGSVRIGDHCKKAT
ncbi:hypothetical protein Ahy_B02g059514 [Arachis hypogaea]|uniref:Aminotransferase-like plant mobile domain-containing protein n=1 Tax=Arachis hypogaea TaxID=3818 RepID=A0A445AGX5_ARAHY|nr:hypothetical protein Ahy_B02g059514 [Arachis hypogaea]